LFELAKDKNPFVRCGVADTIGRNFEKLAEEYRKILFDLSEDKDAIIRSCVAGAVAENFEKLPLKYQKILRTFRSDAPVLDQLKKWDDKKIMDILRQELKL
jgi:hypothetical protein